MASEETMARRSVGSALRQSWSWSRKVAGFPATGEGLQGAGGVGEHLLGAVEGKDGGVGEAAEDGGGEPARAGRELDDLEGVVELGGNQIEERVS